MFVARAFIFCRTGVTGAVQTGNDPAEAAAAALYAPAIDQHAYGHAGNRQPDNNDRRYEQFHINKDSLSGCVVIISDLPRSPPQALVHK